MRLELSDENGPLKSVLKTRWALVDDHIAGIGECPAGIEVPVERIGWGVMGGNRSGSESAYGVNIRLPASMLTPMLA